MNELPKTYADKVYYEKRKRSQIYKALDYILSKVSYFDFFSFDTFQIILNAKYISQSYNNSKITNEDLLLAFSIVNSDFSDILDTFDLTYPKLKKQVILKTPKISKRNYKNLSFKLSQTCSYEINLLFEKAMDNALVRFKTPVITPEILFITLLENHQTKTGKILKNLLGTELKLYLFRYKLLKRLHSQELIVKTEILKNYQYFAYLIKTQLCEIEFNRLLKSNFLFFGILFFRNRLIQRVTPVNINNLLKKEINLSIKLTNTRRYSC